MSGIVGVFQTDGRPVDAGLLGRLTDSIAFRGLDGSGTWSCGNIGFGFQVLWSVPESVGETAPLVDAVTGVAVVMDGRVDNREELLPSLAALFPVSLASRDSQFVLWAYLHWGESFVHHVLGDFAIAIWDPRTRTLHCYRDRMGVRPFYFAERPGLFLFASEKCALLGHPDVDTGLNEGMVGEYLTGSFYSQSETLHSGVARLAPAQVLSVSFTRRALRRYWEPKVAEGRFASAGAAAEELLFELRRAVQCRLRARGPVASHLSGGLDSSTLSALAAEASPAGGLRLYSNVYPGMPCDESFYIDQTRAMLGLPGHSFAFLPIHRNYFADRAARYLDFPGYPNGHAMTDAFCQHQRDQGIRAVLSGSGGNQVLEGEDSFLSDLLRRLRFMDYLGQAPYYRRPGQHWASQLKTALRPLLPIPESLVQARRRHRAGAHPFLLPSFLQRICLEDRKPAPPDWRRYGSIARRDFACGIISAYNVHVLEQNNRGNHEFGLDERLPFADSRVVEFCVGLPEEFRHRDRTYKIALRLAMAGRLPPAVLARKVQAEFSVPFEANLRASLPIPTAPLREFLLPGICDGLERDPFSLIEQAPGLSNWAVWMMLGMALALGAMRRGDSRGTGGIDVE